MKKHLEQGTLVCLAVILSMALTVLCLYGVDLYLESQNTPPHVISKNFKSVIYDSPVKNPAANVKPVDQTGFPSGDEFAAAASFLTAYGYDIDIHGLLDDMNYSDDNFYECYIGDARTDSGYCFAPALVICMNNYLSGINDNMLRTVNVSGISFEELSLTVNNGRPLIVWYTNDGLAPRYNGPLWHDVFQMYDNEQVMVVYGIQNGIVAVADSKQGVIGIDKDKFQKVWEACGSQAIDVYYLD